MRSVSESTEIPEREPTNHRGRSLAKPTPSASFRSQGSATLTAVSLGAIDSATGWQTEQQLEPELPPRCFTLLGCLESKDFGYQAAPAPLSC